MYICKKLQIKYVCMYVCMCSIGFPVSHFLHVWVPCGYPGLADASWRLNKRFVVDSDL